MSQAVQLHQFRLFTWLQGRLEALKPEQIEATTPGKPVPTGAEVIGVMPDHLKALLALRETFVDEASKEAGQAKEVLRTGGGTKEGFTKLLSRRENEIEYIDATFWAAFRAEFPDLHGHDSVGYGPNFEVWSKDKTQEELEEEGLKSAIGGILFGALLAPGLRR